jgi:hypothetical protein
MSERQFCRCSEIVNQKIVTNASAAGLVRTSCRGAFEYTHRDESAVDRRIHFSLPSEPTLNNSIGGHSTTSPNPTQAVITGGAAPPSPPHEASRSLEKTYTPTPPEREPAVADDYQGVAANGDSASDTVDDGLPPAKRRRLARHTPPILASPIEKAPKQISRNALVADKGRL